MAKAGKPSRVTPQDRSVDTRRALVDAAVTTLKTEGFIGASARTIAARAGCNQGLVFYHFGSVASLLLAALDSVSAARRERYSADASDGTSAADAAPGIVAFYLGLEMLTQLDGNRAPATALFDHAGRLAALLGPAPGR